MIEEVMEVPHSGDEKAAKLIHKVLNKYNRNQNFETLTTPPWPAEFFGLNKTTLFQQLSADKQHEALLLSAQALLCDSYGIEKIGIGYCGKLANIAPTMEERQMFSLIGADEATHLQWLTPYVPENLRTTYMSPFLAFMEKMVGFDNPNVLYYLIQIMLEGWSIKHYKALHDACKDEILKTIIKDTLKDESMHHHTGKTFFDATRLSELDKQRIIDVLKGYCEMMRIGPYQVVQALAQTAGGLSIEDKIQLLDELNTHQVCALKLKLFKGLMLQPGMESIVQQLEDQEYLKPITVEHSAMRC